MKFIFAILAIVLVTVSCKKDKEEDQAKKDDDIIKQYITDNNLNATKTGSGLYYIIDNQGTGDGCNSSSSVKVSYKGYFTSGGVFDQSSANGISFNLQSVIKGWTEGIPYFKEGGQGKLLVPSALGYGKDGNGSIPGNTVLIFDVKLIEVL